MLEWLIPVSVFWTLSALYLGGAALRIEGGSVRQLIGLFVDMAMFLGVWYLGRMVFSSVVPTLAAAFFGTLVAGLLLRPVARIAFRLVGVKLTPDRDASPVESF